MKIGIIGAGWYGCHLASALTLHGHEITLYEAGDDVLQRASSLNQARLHAGYHYPRSYATRSETVECFKRFIRTYPHFTMPIEHNVYAISNRYSVMDFITYTQIMRNLGLQFYEVDPQPFGLQNVEGVLSTEERGLNFDEARRHFHKTLGTKLRLGHKVKSVLETDRGVHIDGQHYDVAINATWCGLEAGPVAVPGLFFEPTTLFYYEAKEPFYGAVTTMDGACFSVYPYHGNIYTLSHVAYTPRGQFASFAEADAVNNGLTESDLDAIRAKMVEDVLYEFPSFLDRFMYVGVQKSVKTKYTNACASRKTYVMRQGRVLNILSGKIDTIFIAEDIILETLLAMQRESSFQGSFLKAAGDVV